MFDSLRGPITANGDGGSLTIEAAGTGMGYRVRTLYRDRLPPSPTEILYFIRARFSQDEGYTFFGFRDPLDRAAFDLLLTVSGVGGTRAMALLEEISPAALGLILRSGDAKALSKIPGFGMKTADRTVVELKDKYQRLIAAASSGDMVDNEREVSALVTLGYPRGDALRAVRAVVPAPGALKPASGEILRRAITWITAPGR